MQTLPRDDRSVFIRSIFASGRGGHSYHPLSVAGYNSTQLLQFMNTFVTEFDAGRIVTYSDLVDHGYVAP